MSNKNPILHWSWSKPTEEGLYLACRGDVETPANIEPFRIVPNIPKKVISEQGWPCYTADQVSGWHSSFKFAKLSIGSDMD